MIGALARFFHTPIPVVEDMTLDDFEDYFDEMEILAKMEAGEDP